MSLKLSMLHWQVAQLHFSALGFSSFAKLYHSFQVWHRQLRARWWTEQSREQSLKWVQGGLCFPELPKTHRGQQWNDMESDRTDCQVKPSIWWITCNSKMCTEMQDLVMVTISDILMESWGGSWKLYFSSVKIPLGLWPRLDHCQWSVI